MTIRLHTIGKTKLVEVGTLAVFLFVAMMCFAFANLAGAVGEGETHAFDNAVMMAMRSAADPADPVGPEWFEEAVGDITSLDSATVLVIVSAAAARAGGTANRKLRG